MVSVPGETERGNAPRELPCPFLAKLRSYKGRAVLRNKKITLTLDLPTQKLANLLFVSAYDQFRSAQPRAVNSPSDVPPIPEPRIEKRQSKRDALMVRSKPNATRARETVANKVGENFYCMQERIAEAWERGTPPPEELTLGVERTAGKRGSHSRLPQHQQLRSTDAPSVPNWLADLVGRKHK